MQYLPTLVNFSKYNLSGIKKLEAACPRTVCVPGHIVTLYIERMYSLSIVLSDFMMLNDVKGFHKIKQLFDTSSIISLWVGDSFR